MISDLFSGWPWTTNLFLCNDYIIVRLGKKMLKDYDMFPLVDMINDYGLFLL